MKLGFLASAIAVVVLLASGGASAQTPLTKEDLAAVGIRLASERCKTPQSVSSRKVQNAYEPEVTDTVRLIRCPQLELSVYLANTYSPPRELLDYLVVKSRDPRVPRSIGVGASRASVLANLPAPSTATAEALTYILNEEGSGEDALVVVLSGGRVRELRWTWHLE